MSSSDSSAPERRPVRRLNAAVAVLAHELVGPDERSDRADDRHRDGQAQGDHAGAQRPPRQSRHIAIQPEPVGQAEDELDAVQARDEPHDEQAPRRRPSA